MSIYTDLQVVASHGYYVLLHSQQREDATGLSFSLLYFPGDLDPDPFHHECAESIEFNHLAAALLELDTFPPEHHAELTAWLREYLT